MGTMEERLDIIIFGASGFTGKYSVLQLFNIAKDFPNLTWGIAGRNETKLKDILNWLHKKTEHDFSKIPIIIADVTDDVSVLNMAKQAKIVINCVGPFRLYGEPVVTSCIAAGTHYIDITGEQQFIDRIRLEYDKAAQEKGVYIISACGFESIPVDMGVIFLQNHFDGTVNSVKCVVEFWTEKLKYLYSTTNYGTWHSAVHVAANWNEVNEMNSKLESDNKLQCQPELEQRKLVHKDETTGKWCVPLLSSDRDIALRSQQYLHENDNRRPAQIQTYLAFDNLFLLCGAMTCFSYFAVMTQFSLGRKLLLSYPRLFSGGTVTQVGPSEESMNKAWFKTTLKAEGWTSNTYIPEYSVENTIPINKTMVAQIKASNPGYGFTCIALVLSALMIVKETDKLPNRGGVFSPGAAFAKTSLLDQLAKYGISYIIK